MNLIFTKRGIRFRRSDGMRAGEVIRGLRALGRKSGPQLSRLDVDDVIGQVLVIARGELLRRNVVLRTEMDSGGRSVLGDRVQLQQVLLKLITDGIEAMNGVTAGTRELRSLRHAVCSSRSETRAQSWIRQSRSACSSPSSRRNRTVLGCRRVRPMAPMSASLFRCRQIASGSSPSLGQPPSKEAAWNVS
jgi:hypothetical protein